MLRHREDTVSSRPRHCVLPCGRGSGASHPRWVCV